jgi:LysM repeat protein
MDKLNGKVKYIALIVFLLSALLAAYTPQLGATAPRPMADSVHIVRWGETLSSIAARYGVTVGALARANHLRNPNFIYAGQRLVVPGNTTPLPASQRYVVKPGDTLTTISAKFGVSVYDLIQLNRIRNPNLLWVGQVLLIPGSGGVGQKLVDYKVKPGDTLFLIASRYHTSIWNLVSINHLASPNLIFVGQVLKVPVQGTVTPTPTPKPTATPSQTATPTQTPQPTSTTTPSPTATPTATLAAGTPTPAPTPTATPGAGTPTATPTPTSTPAPTNTPAAPTATPQPPTPTPAPSSGETKWIDISLSHQRLIAYEGNKVFLSALISSGVPSHPTVIGRFRIYMKLVSQRMVGPGYNLPNVPWVMYFYDGYAIHGTYWHHNFGHPMSHGCINMTIEDAHKLYNWAPKGTLVVIHW